MDAYTHTHTYIYKEEGGGGLEKRKKAKRATTWTVRECSPNAWTRLDAEHRVRT